MKKEQLENKLWSILCVITDIIEKCINDVYDIMLFDPYGANLYIYTDNDEEVHSVLEQIEKEYNLDEDFSFQFDGKTSLMLLALYCLMNQGEENG